MNTETEAQPESGAQEEVQTPVADKLGHLDEHSLSDLLKSGFLDEEEAAPAVEGQQKEEPEAAVESLSDEAPQEEEGESDQPEADESSLTKGVQKRINKLVAAKKAAQAELEAHKQMLQKLNNELQQTKMSIPAPAPEYSDFVESIDTPEKLQDEYKKTIDYLLWCEENADGGTITLPDGTEKELSDKQVRAAKSVFIKRKEIELPARFQYLQNQIQHDAQAMSDFPWYTKPETEEYRMAQIVLRDFPEIKKRRSDWKHIVGLMVLGAKAHIERSSQPKKAAPIKKAPVQPGVSKAPPMSASSDNDLAKAKARFVKNSSDQQGIKDLVKAMGFA